MWFGKVFNLIEKVQQLDSDKIAVTIYFDKDIEKFILRKNRIDQLVQGLDSDNQIIGIYSIGTALSVEDELFTFEDTTVLKLAGEPYNFIDSGDFFKSFKLVVYADGFSIVANDNKDGERLTEKYGKEILGLNQKNKHELAKQMLPLFIKQVRKQLFK